MALQRPTLQARKGYDPNGYGPGVNSPFGYSPGYFSGTVKHNGQDYFWCKPETAARLGITTAQSQEVYAALNGPIHHADDLALGDGLYQQIDSQYRIYYWHLSSRTAPRSVLTTTRVGVMGDTGTAGNGQVHLHLEVRKMPYRSIDRVDPEPFFSTSVTPATGGGSTPIPITPSPTATNPGENMNLMRTTDGTIWLVTSNGMAPIKTLAHLDLIQRVIKGAPGTFETFHDAERLAVLGYIHAANTSDDAETQRILAALGNVKPILDPAPVVEAVRAALAATGVQVDADKIAIAVETRLKDDFSAIPAQVNADAARRLAQ